MSSAVNVCGQSLQFSQMMFINTSRGSSVFIAQNRGRCCRYGVLRAVAHELRNRTGYVGNADVLSSHHDIVEVRSVKTPEGNVERFVVACVPRPAL